MSAIKTMNEFVTERLRELMAAAAADIAKAVHPIYCGSARGRAEHLGSCVLLKWKARHLLLTAAHVIDANKAASLHIPVKGKLRKLEGSGVLTTAPGGIRERDRLDFCIMDLPQDLTRDLGDIRYVMEHELASAGTPGGHAYMAFGYPNSKNKPDHARVQIVPRRFSYGGPLARSVGGSEDQHLRIKYDKRSRTIEGDVVASIEPRGMSGGAMFDLGRFLDTSDSLSPIGAPFRLAGLLIERRRQEKMIVATRIETVLSVL
jgi:Trypsin-like peptidase domain